MFEWIIGIQASSYNVNFEYDLLKTFADKGNYKITL